MIPPRPKMQDALIAEAMAHYGISEIPGRRHRPEILDFLIGVGLGDDWAQRDETPWCAAFVTHVAATCGAQRSTKPTARSWMRIGQPVFLGDAVPGDVVVLERGRKAWQGHVGFFVRLEKMAVQILGGNQGNRVCVQAYATARVLAVRRLGPAGPLSVA